MRSICVIGLGYIGLPTASLLATKGYKVHGVDVNQKIVDALNKGDVLIHEPALDVMVRSAVGSGNLTASTSPVEADVFILAVPTPFKNGKQPDLTYVESAVRAIAPCVRPGNLVVLESTSPVGTTDKICEMLREMCLGLPVPGHVLSGYPQVYVAHCPERVLPGRILEELVGNDRVVGGVDSASTEIAVKFYRSFVQGEVCATNARTAELVKLTENAFRDVNIAFANELSLICAELEINVWDAIRFANLHPRVNILQPGPGVGGHCIAVDPWFIVASSPNTARLIRTAREVNDSKPEWVIQEVRTQANRFKKPRVACLGLAFKADIDDLRESPALYIVEQLAQSEGMELFVVEPYIKELPASLALFSSVQLMGLKNALLNSDIVLILVEHRQFKDIDSSSLMAKFVIDTKGLIHNKQRLKG